MSERGTAGERQFRIAAVQMVSAPDVAANLVTAERLIADAAQRGAMLVVLPEYFPLVGMNERDKIAVREKDGAGPMQDFLQGMAAQYGIWLVGGSVPLEATVPDKVRNSCLAYDDRGRRVARYDKIHLFGFERGSERYNESATIEAGAQVVTFASPLGRVG
ncbi:MAG: nitrilase/cyanide hydratase and apolipoprotein N-acyltransferase, partial [Proteobacteria bacterium]|nr:nitrilase/cyanide hydratase and apolipoprotein N-acyltransferase [Pseudomonadota bacterium]